MIPYYCGRCGSLDEMGAQAHRCASNGTTVLQPKITNTIRNNATAIPNEEPAKLTKAQRAAAWNTANRDLYNERNRKRMKDKRAEAKAKRGKPV